MAMRSKQKTNPALYWGLGGLVIILALALWAWPTYLANPDLSSEMGASSTVDQAGHLDVQGAFQKRQEGAFLLDVRTQEEWNAGHIPGAVLIPLDLLAGRAGELPEDKEIVIYCRSGNRSAQALDLLSGVGLSDIFSMDGGINDWILAGHEVEIGE